MHDDALEAGFARHDATAFERAYERFGAQMYGTALRILANDALARECVHDVLLHLWQREDAYRPERGKLEAFLVVCVRNAALVTVRNAKRREQILAAAVPPDTATYDPDPLEQADVANAVSQLSPVQAQVVELAYYQGMTHHEIAAQLHEPVGTIKSRLSSALSSLRTLVPKEVIE